MVEFKEHKCDSLSYISVEPDDFNPNNNYPVLVLLHGFGASMHDLANLSMAIDPDRYIYIFPNGPIEIQVGYGITGYAWSKINEDETSKQSEDTDEILKTLITDLVGKYGSSPTNTILGGFSQGGMMSYRLGLPNPDMFAGLIVLSGSVRDENWVKLRLPDERSQPIFIAHGTSDVVVGVEDARRSKEFLEQEGYAPDYHEYPVGHEIVQDEIRDLKKWLDSVLFANSVS